LSTTSGKLEARVTVSGTGSGAGSGSETGATPSGRAALARVALGASFISTAAVFVKYLAIAGVGETEMGAFRCLLGGAVLVPLVSLRGAPLWPGGRVARMAVIAGFFFAIDLFLWHRSIVMVGAGVATILANTQIFWTTFLTRVLYGEQITARFAASAVAAFGGVVLLIGVGSDVSFTPEYTIGIAFGVVTGVAYAGYVLSMQRAALLQGRDARTEPLGALSRAMVTLCWASIACGLFLFITALVEGGSLMPPSTHAWLLLAGLALVPQVLGWLSITSGLLHLPAARGGLVLLVQPTLATLWGVMLFGERLGPLQIGGAVVTLAAIYHGSRART
jgi:drug/metabolite transporter (DMT)-like permease